MGERARGNDRSRSRSNERRPMPAGGRDGRTTTADMWGMAKNLWAEKERREAVGQPVFFKGNKSTKTEPGIKTEVKTEPGIKKEKRTDDDMQYSTITEEVLTKDEMDKKI